MTGADLAGEVSTDAAYVVPAVGERRFTVAAVDLGIKAHDAARMAERGIEVHVLPAASTVDDVLAVAPDGVFLSNGPGDPGATTEVVALAGAVLERRIPFFGICFGNQLLGRALGLDTYKLSLRPPRHQPAGARPHHRQGRGHRAQPRLRGARPRGRGRRSAVRHPARPGEGLARLPERRRRRGARVPRRAGLLRAVPPRGRRRPARRRLPVRPLRRPDGRRGPAQDTPACRRPGSHSREGE